VRVEKDLDDAHMNVKELSNALHAVEAWLVKAKEDGLRLALAHADMEKEAIALQAKNGHLKALQEKIIDDPVQKKTMQAMCNMKLAFILAMNKL